MRVAAHLATLAALTALGLGLGRWLREPNLGGFVFLVLLAVVVWLAVLRLYRPQGAVAERPEAPEAEPSPRDHRVDINSAGVDELQRLPGVGPVAAARIVAERDAGGPFATVEALTRVPGFGPAKVRVLEPGARV